MADTVFSRHNAGVMAAGVLALFLIRAWCPTPQQDAPAVSTDCGDFVGVVEDGVNVYKGMAYARPPVENLRWKRTVPLKPGDDLCRAGETVSAAEFGPPCAQIHPISGQAIGSESCLSINVWSPVDLPGSEEDLLPVVVWIHGGYFMFASGDFPGYSPTAEAAAATNAVLVSFNFRVNVFGFLALDVLEDHKAKSDIHGNYGLWDIVEALKWIQQNIAKFGGDPNRVTIYGHSSGRLAVLGLLTSPLTTSLFQRAWISSSDTLLESDPKSADHDHQHFLKKLGCATGECLRKVATEDLLHVMPITEYPFWLASFGTDLPTKGEVAGALMIIDGKLIVDSPTKAIKEGGFLDIPLLISSTTQEISFSPVAMDVKEWSWENYTSYVAGKLGTFGGDVTAGAMHLYPITEDVDPEYLYTTMASDIRVVCPVQSIHRAAGKKALSPVYQMLIRQRPSVPCNPLPLPFKPKYAAHSADVAAFFGYSEWNSPAVLTDSDLAFQRVIRENVAEFARAGKVKDPNWRARPHYVAMVDNQLQMEEHYHKEQCQFWDERGFEKYAWGHA